MSYFALPGLNLTLPYLTLPCLSLPCLNLPCHALLALTAYYFIWTCFTLPELTWPGGIQAILVHPSVQAHCFQFLYCILQQFYLLESLTWKQPEPLDSSVTSYHSTTNQLVSNWTLFKNKSANQRPDFSLEPTTRVTSVTYIAVSCPAQLYCLAVVLTVSAMNNSDNLCQLVLTKQNALPWCPTESLWHEVFPCGLTKISSSLKHASPINHVKCLTYSSLLPLLSLLLSFSMGRSSMGCYINEDRRKLKMCWETHRLKVTGYFMCMYMSCMLRALLIDDVKYLVLPAVQDASPMFQLTWILLFGF